VTEVTPSVVRREAGLPCNAAVSCPRWASVLGRQNLAGTGFRRTVAIVGCGPGIGLVIAGLRDGSCRVFAVKPGA